MTGPSSSLTTATKRPSGEKATGLALNADPFVPTVRNAWPEVASTRRTRPAASLRANTLPSDERQPSPLTEGSGLLSRSAAAVLAFQVCLVQTGSLVVDAL